jgi:MFS superfamily sulfate permease-like transporter
VRNQLAYRIVAAAGVIAFAPLGRECLGAGVLAGMLSSIVAGLLASLSGSAPGMIVGPQAHAFVVPTS